MSGWVATACWQLCSWMTDRKLHQVTSVPARVPCSHGQRLVDGDCWACRMGFKESSFSSALFKYMYCILSKVFDFFTTLEAHARGLYCACTEMRCIAKRHVACYMCAPTPSLKDLSGFPHSSTATHRPWQTLSGWTHPIPTILMTILFTCY